MHRHRQGANPWRVIKQLREKLLQPAAAMQVPMGAFDELEGVFDLVKWKAIRYEGESGCAPS
jgi:elongation factor G